VGPAKEDICYATQNRQNAVKRLAPMTQLMLVVGSPNSSNSNRLRELAERLGTEAYLIDSPEQIQPAWLKDKKHIGVTAGASAPESLVQAVVNRLSSLGATTLEDSSGEPENVTFAMPKALRIVS
jgi:4-hydroxy-3-methylbut-2-enyl diphosphate reductase